LVLLVSITHNVVGTPMPHLPLLHTQQRLVLAINSCGKILLLNKNKRSTKNSVAVTSPEIEVAEKIAKFIFCNYI
jgi:hypothetical protein